MYLTDLIFIEDGNVDKISVAAADANGEPLALINWRKHEAYASIIDEVRFYQQDHYNLRLCEPLDEYLRTALTDPAVVLNEKEQCAPPPPAPPIHSTPPPPPPLPAPPAAAPRLYSAPTLHALAAAGTSARSSSSRAA